MIRPLVSVVLPAFNQATLLPETLRSLRTQTLPLDRWETIVIDDGSTDETQEILSRQADWLRIIRQPNQGLPASCNAGLRLAQGKYLARIDSDDLAAPEWLEWMAAALEGEPTASCAVPDRYETDAEGKRLVRADPANLYSLIACGTLFRTEQLRAVGGYHSLYWEEYDLYLRLKPLGPFTRVPRPLYTYRRHQAAMTSNPETRRRGWRELAETWGAQALRAAGRHVDLEEALR